MTGWAVAHPPRYKAIKRDGCQRIGGEYMPKTTTGIKFKYKIKGIERRKFRFAMAVMIPTIILYLVLRIIPILCTFYLSFHQWNLIRPFRPFIGLENFAKILEHRSFRVALGNTTIFTVFVVIISIILALLLALALKKKSRIGRFYEFAYFLPFVIPMVPV